MADIRTAVSRVAAALILFFFFAGAGSARAADVLLTGVVRDTLGQVLENVEVYVLPERATLPIAFAQTRADGRYVIDRVPAGTYRIAGLKPGYLAVFGRVNTSLHSTLDLLLAPAPAPGEAGSEQDPGNAKWALRLPERSVLRDVDNVPLGRVAGPPDGGASFRPEVEGQVEQLFALGRVGSGPKSESAVQGTETRLRLGGNIGQRGNVRLQGRRESLDATLADGDPRGSSASKATDLLLDLTYDPTSDTNVNVKSYYARQDLLAGDEPAPSSRRSERAWGCEARWARQLSARSRVDVGVHYLDSLVETPDPADAAGSNRAVGTRGTFESVTAGGHQLQFGFHARGQVQAEPSVPSLPIGAYGARAGIAGWNVGLDARDAWSISTRASLLYGLGYYQPLDLRSGAPMAVPRIGGLWSGEHLRLRGIVSYHEIVPHEGSRSAVDSPIGYEAEAQVPLPAGFVARGDVSFTPVQSYEAASGTDFATRPLYVTSGDAASRRAAFTVERTSGGTTTTVELARGSADGMISVLTPFHGSLGVIEDEQIQFRTGRLGVRIAPSGTELAAEYRSVLEVASDGDRASERRSLELRFAQDLARLQGGGSCWRFLLVARGTSGEQDLRESDEGTAFAEIGREVSAGISVAF